MEGVAQDTASNSTGFVLSGASGDASHVLHGGFVLTLMNPNTNTWVFSGESVLDSIAVVAVASGIKSLSSGLTQIRLTTVAGGINFDAGSFNIMYE